MKKLIYILSICSLCFGACSASNKPVCEDLICTMEFRMVQVKFIDASGNPVTVKDFSSIIKRTNNPVMKNNDPAGSGVYTVASDADLKQLSEKGDIIMVSATHPQTNKKIETEFVISGGLCACHINKISGPAEILF